MRNISGLLEKFFLREIACAFVSRLWDRFSLPQEDLMGPPNHIPALFYELCITLAHFIPDAT
jgi:hypothetical protein